MKNNLAQFVSIGIFAATMCALIGCGSETADSDQDTAAQGSASGTDVSLEPVAYTNADGELICPVMGSVTTKETAVGHADHNGKRYYFCCDGCPQAFSADPEKYAQVVAP